jgi:hypothetical protein
MEKNPTQKVKKLKVFCLPEAAALFPNIRNHVS